MPHKLIFGARIVSLSDYSRFLSVNEAVAGRNAELTVTIENIGDAPIPEGALTVALEKPVGMGSFTVSINPLKIPALKPTEKFSSKTVVDGERILVEPGFWVLTATIKLGDEEPVEYYHSKITPPNADRWVWTFHLADRHQLDMQQLLEKLLEKKEE